jgi:hypothetical protein
MGGCISKKVYNEVPIAPVRLNFVPPAEGRVVFIVIGRPVPMQPN